MADAGSRPGIRADGLQLDEDRPLQERIWTVERVAHAGLFLVVLVTLAGLTGNGGPLAEASAAGGGGRVDYPRITRVDAPATFSFAFAGTRAEHRVRIAGGFPERFRVEDVSPEPLRQSAGGESLTFELAAGEEEPGRAVVRLRGLQPGLSRLEIAIDDAAPMAASVFLLP
jgi:hypothetical protein